MHEDPIMTDTAPTLNDVFSHDGQSASDGLRDSDRVAAAAQSVSREAGEHHPEALAEAAAEKLPALLDVPVGTVLARAWSSSKLLASFLKSIRESGDEPVRLPLREHTIASSHHPSVEVLVNEKVVDRLDFEIALTLTLKGAVLEARRGRIAAVHTGECIAAGEVGFEGVPLIKRESAPFELPGTIEFEGGIEPRGDV